MSHMCMIGNLILAIGGRPKIAFKSNCPVFPSRMPFGMLKNEVITLGPLTKEQILNVFLPIEKPKHLDKSMNL
jgi:hypothetical protein